MSEIPLKYWNTSGLTYIWLIYYICSCEFTSNYQQLKIYYWTRFRCSESQKYLSRFLRIFQRVFSVFDNTGALGNVIRRGFCVRCVIASAPIEFDTHFGDFRYRYALFHYYRWITYAWIFYLALLLVSALQLKP